MKILFICLVAICGWTFWLRYCLCALLGFKEPKKIKQDMRFLRIFHKTLKFFGHRCKYDEADRSSTWCIKGENQQQVFVAVQCSCGKAKLARGTGDTQRIAYITALMESNKEMDEIK